MQLPADHLPVFSWRCAAHRRYKMREASAPSATRAAKPLRAILSLTVLNLAGPIIYTNYLAALNTAYTPYAEQPITSLE
jgi:hypothetical protein